MASGCRRSSASGWPDSDAAWSSRRRRGAEGAQGYDEGVATLTFPVSNDLAQELGSDRDRLLAVLGERLGCGVHMRGNQVSVEGDDAVVAQARILIEELEGLVAQGLPI